MHQAMEGKRPQKPEAAESLGFTDGLWGTIEQCWLVDISARPDVRTILSLYYEADAPISFVFIWSIATIPLLLSSKYDPGSR